MAKSIKQNTTHKASLPPPQNQESENKQQNKVTEKGITAEAAAVATLRLMVIPKTNWSLNAAASVEFLVHYLNETDWIYNDLPNTT